MRHTVIGGGIAGLVAAVELGRRGVEVQLVEGRRGLGGRAVSQVSGGFVWNLGPHALYRDGLALRALGEWGIRLSGGTPQLAGNAYLVRAGERFALPLGFAGLATTGVMGVREKLDFAGAYRKLTGMAPEAGRGKTVAQFLDAEVSTGGARTVLEALIRLSTYGAEPGALDLELTLRQLGLSGGGVVYLDGGWQSLVDALEREARAVGVEIRTGEAVDQLAGPAVLAVGPEEAERLAGAKIERAAPLRMATLDLALDALPEGAPYFGLGVDAPLYFSVHTQWAKLAPGAGAVVHAAKYLAKGAGCDRNELEDWCDLLMPGWRRLVKDARFLPDLHVVQAAPVVHGRPEVDALGRDGVMLAGDWVGEEGMLADAAVASGLRAARMLVGQAVAA